MVIAPPKNRCLTRNRSVLIMDSVGWLTCCPEQDSTVSLYQRPTRSLYSALGTEGHRPIKCPKSDNSHLSWGTNCDITISESLVRKGAMGSFRHPWFHLGNSSQLGPRSLILETNFPYCLLNLTPFFQETTEHRGPPWGALCSQLMQWRKKMCSCFKYIRVLYFLTPTTTNSPSSPTSQFILHRLQGSVPQVCPHCRGQSQMGCSSYPHFCPTTR